jgi:hypothetical protein
VKNYHAAHGSPKAHARTTSDLSATLSFTSDADIPRYPDDDGSLTVGALPTLTTIHEQRDVGGDTTSSLAQGEPHAIVPSPSVDNNALVEATTGEAQEVKSRHTSRTSTVNGDEIGYEENNQADAESKHGSEQHLERLGDEIDWDHDGEEDGERETAAPTPSGKRSRTNEIDGLSDGTGTATIPSFALDRTAANDP